MTGVSTTNSYNTAAANSVTTVFNFTFFAYTTDQIKVYTVDGDDEPVEVTTGITKVLNSTFIGGTVTFAVAPVTGLDVIIRREVAYTQTVEFSNLTRYKETAIEEALNTLVLQIQQNNARVNLSLQYLENAGATNPRVGTPEDGAALIFDGVLGKLIAGPTADDIENAQGYAAAGAGYVTQAAGHAADAADAADSAQASAESLFGTSFSSVTIGTGSKSFVTDPNRIFLVGTWLIAVEANGTAYIHGQVTAYNSDTGALTMNVTSAAGAGTFAAWIIIISGVQGPPGDASDLQAVSVDFDNTASGLTSTDVQNAIDEMAGGALSFTVNALTEITVPAIDDFLGVADTSNSGVNRKITWQNGLEVLNLLTEDASPDTANDFLLSFDVSDGTVKKVKQNLVGQAGLTTVGQGNLRTSTGTASISANAFPSGSEGDASAVGSQVTLPGGQYGFAVQSRNASPNSRAGACGHTAYNTSGSFVQAANAFVVRQGNNTSSATFSMELQQRYVTASPPFNIGNGEMAGFLFLLMNMQGEVKSHYLADVPPWAYNGPTDISPDFIDTTNGKKYRMRTRGKSTFAKILEAKPGERIITGRPDEMLNAKYDKEIKRVLATPVKDRRDALGNFYKDRAGKIKGEFIADHLEEIDDRIKNADMPLLPHPFMGHAGDEIVVLVDPYDDKIFQFVEYQNLGGGQEIVDAIKAGKITVDLSDEIQGKISPPGVRLCRLKIK